MFIVEIFFNLLIVLSVDPSFSNKNQKKRRQQKIVILNSQKQWSDDFSGQFDMKKREESNVIM